MKAKLILASQSPRRRELLTQWGYEFVVMTPAATAECGVCSRETPAELVARLALQKARDVAARVGSGVVLGCDTVAACHGQILGKPSTRKHAEEMLRLMRGRPHQVFSGVCLWERPTDRILVEVDVTQLIMDPVSDQLLQAYLDSQAWQGKAGAFGYQDGLDWVHIIRGSETNVVGLPMELFENMLSRLNAC